MLDIITAKAMSKSGGSGGGGVTIDLIYDNPEQIQPVNNGYTLTPEVNVAQYKFVIIYCTDQANSNAVTSIMSIFPTGTTPTHRFYGTSGGQYELIYDAETNTFTGTKNYNGQNCLKRMYGVK